MSPIKQAIEKICTDCAVYDFSDTDDFKALWDFSKLLHELEVNNCCKLILLATGVPPADGNNEDGDFSKWVNVDAWLAAFALKVAEDSKTIIPPVYVLYLDPLDTGRHLLRQRVKNSPATNDIFHLFSSSSEKWTGESFFLDDFSGYLKTHSQKKSVKFDDIEKFRQSAWMALCADCAPDDLSAENRHDASNQLGAMILAMAFEVSEPDDESHYRFAARRMLEQLLCPSSNCKPVPELPSDVKSQEWLLIDDYCKEYFPVLEKIRENDKNSVVIGRKGVFRLHGDKDIELTTDNEIKSNEIKRILNYITETDILFLDLRLWSAEEDAAKKTIKCYSHLASHLIKEKNYYPESTPRKALEKVCCDYDPDAYSHRDLAILPLLIASIDPTLPIVLFSSTQHRSVIHAVRDCPSIITDFSKPYLFSGDADTSNPELVGESLLDAIEKASRMADLRKPSHMENSLLDEFKRINNEDEFKRINIKIQWLEGWPELLLDSAPVNWLVEKWFPVAQREHYMLAAALPWLYLGSTFGDTRLELMRKGGTKDQKKCLTLMHRAFTLFATKPVDDKRSAEMERDIALAAITALIELLRLCSHQVESVNGGNAHDF